MGLDDALADGQTDAHPPGGVPRQGHGLAGPDGLEHLRRQPPALVPNLRHRPVVPAVQAQDDVLQVAGVADGVLQKVDDDLLDQQRVHGQVEDVLRQVQLHVAVREAPPGGEQGVPCHLLQHLLPLFQGDGAVLHPGDGQQVLHHDDQSVGVLLDVGQHSGVFVRDVRAGQQHRGRPGDRGQRGAQVVGHRPQNVLPDGDAFGLKLDGRLFRIEPLVLLVESLGLLLPADGLQGLALHPGGEGTHHAGDGHHGQHGHRIARPAE